jgi:hypothetical protein
MQVNWQQLSWVDYSRIGVGVNAPLHKKIEAVKSDFTASASLLKEIKGQN